MQTEPLTFPAFDRSDDDFINLVHRDLSVDNFNDDESDYLRTADAGQSLEWLAVLVELADDLALQRCRRKCLWELAKERHERGTIGLNTARSEYEAWIRSVNGFTNLVINRSREVDRRISNLQHNLPANFIYSELKKELKTLRNLVVDLASQGNKDALITLGRAYGRERATEMCRERLKCQPG